MSWLAKIQFELIKLYNVYMDGKFKYLKINYCIMSAIFIKVITFVSL